MTLRARRSARSPQGADVGASPTQGAPFGPATRASSSSAFTLIELLVVIAIVALLMGLLVPSLARARESARAVRCLSNQRSLIIAWTSYAGEHRDRAMPLAYWSVEDIGAGEQVFWWGTHGTPTTPPRHERGFIAPYLDAALAPTSAFECASQPWGTYRAQGPARSPTSTYGYNGYFLSPAKTPGWAYSIGHRPWQRLGDIRAPETLLVFADTLLAGSAGSLPGNTALLDPPMLFTRASGWSTNQSPTTAFRHARSRAGAPGAANAALADGHARSFHAENAWCTDDSRTVGSIAGHTVAPHYVPDWESWSAP